jgi:large subunit ribosomal protein L5
VTKTDQKEKVVAPPKEKKSSASAAGGAKSKRGKGEGTGQVKIAESGQTRVSPSKVTRLQADYNARIVPLLMKELGVKNPMEVPRLKKVTVNCAVKEAVGNPKVLDGTFDEVMAITGQKPVLTRAKKAIAAFKVRQGNAVGVMVTLRRARMYEFLDRLINVALPRVRDFKGLNPKGFDGRGNYSLGIREQIIFPEINYDKVDKVRGMTVTIETSASKNEQARALLVAIGMPFRK